MMFKAYTDCPIESLGDIAYQKAPIREIEILAYDGNKYCLVKVENTYDMIKYGYIYSERGRCGEVDILDFSDKTDRLIDNYNVYLTCYEVIYNYNELGYNLNYDDKINFLTSIVKARHQSDDELINNFLKYIIHSED